MRVEAANQPAFVLALRRESQAPAAAEQGRAAADVLVDVVPRRPPADVVAAIEQAARVASDLAMQNRELHFSKDQASGRIIVQVRDLRGNVIRTIPPSTALETLAPGAWR